MLRAWLEGTGGRRRWKPSMGKGRRGHDSGSHDQLDLTLDRREYCRWTATCLVGCEAS